MVSCIRCICNHLLNILFLWTCMFCRRHCSFYGLKHAPSAWFQHFASVVIVVDFFASNYDLALFVHTSSRDWIFLLHVDDMIITGSYPEYIGFMNARLSEQFLMFDLGLLH